MHIFLGDPLRDPIWQFLGVVVSIILGVTGLLLPYVIPAGKSKEEKLKLTYYAIIRSDPSLGCSGLLFLFVLLIAASYFLYILLLRVYFLGLSLDQSALLITSFAILFCITIFLSIIRHSQLLFVLVLHFCIVTVIFVLIMISLKFGTFIFEDFTFVKQAVVHFLAQSNPDIKDIPIQLNAIPVDIIITDRSAAQTIFIWEWGISLFFFLFFYSLYRRRENLRASAFAYQSSEARQIILQELEKEDKEVTIQMKLLDREKMRVTYAHDLSVTLANVVEPEADTTTRTLLIQQFFPDFLKIGSKKTEDIIMPHLKSFGALPAAPAKPLKKSTIISNLFDKAVGFSPVILKPNGQSAKVGSIPPSNLPQPPLSQTGQSQSTTPLAKPTLPLVNEFQLPSVDIPVPDLQNLDYVTALEQASRFGMRIDDDIDEEARTDVAPGKVVYQFPQPGTIITVKREDINKNNPDIFVTLSREPFETKTLPVTNTGVGKNASSSGSIPNPVSKAPLINKSPRKPKRLSRKARKGRPKN